MNQILAVDKKNQTTISFEENIYRICDEIIEAKRWRAFRDTKINFTKTTIPFGAFITLHDRRIYLNINHDFKSSLESMVNDEGIKISEKNAIKAIIYHLLVHEYNHHNYCPRSPELFKEITSSIADVISKKEYKKEKVKALSLEIHNLFSDTVINTIAAHDDQQFMNYRIGKDLADLLILNYNAKHSGFIKPKRFDKALQLFLESNLYLCDTNPEMYKKMKKYLPRFFKGQEYLEAIVNVFMQNHELEKRIFDKNLSDYDSLEIYDRMSNYRLWGSKAEEYTKIIYPFLKREHDWLKNSFSGKGQQYSDGMKEEESTQGQGAGQQENDDKKQKGKKGGGSRDEEKEIEEKKDNQQNNGGGKREEKVGKDKQQGKDGGSENKQIDEDKKEKQSNNGGGNEEESLGEYGKNENAKSSKQPNDKFDDFIKIYIQSKRKSIPDYSGSLAELDELYKERAGELNLFADENVLTEKFEVFRGKELMTDFNMRNIDWPSIRFIERLDGTTDLELYQRELPLEIDASVHKDLGGVPDLCFVFDSSGSMGFNPRAGTGEYHTAVLTFYSIVNGLEKKGIAPLLNYNVINFSDTTFSSGWHCYKELMEVKDKLFRYQGGWTALNVQELKKIRDYRRDNYILFLLSDLGLNNQKNFEELEKELIDTHESRAAHVLIFKLGGDDILSKSFERKGISVIYPRNINDFMYESIKFTKDVYAGGSI